MYIMFVSMRLCKKVDCKNKTGTMFTNGVLY